MKEPAMRRDFSNRPDFLFHQQIAGKLQPLLFDISHRRQMKKSPEVLIKGPARHVGDCNEVFEPDDVMKVRVDVIYHSLDVPGRRR